MWHELYDESNMPTLEDIKKYINNEVYNEFCAYIESTYKILPKVEYSKCSMQKGWNIKYKKSGKSICIIYPESDCFIALVVVNERNRTEIDFMIPSCNTYVQDLYKNTRFLRGSAWLMIKVNDNSTIEDVKKLIAIKTIAS